METEAKKELKYKHGVKTGTLRRSIHTAEPDFGWTGDDVEPAPNSPERGGSFTRAVRGLRGIVIAVGSGMSYAMAVHQGHHSFDGYHFITNGLERAKNKLKKIIEKSTLSSLT